MDKKDFLDVDDIADILEEDIPDIDASSDVIDFDYDGEDDEINNFDSVFAAKLETLDVGLGLRNKIPVPDDSGLENAEEDGSTNEDQDRPRPDVGLDNIDLDRPIYNNEQSEISEINPQSDLTQRHPTSSTDLDANEPGPSNQLDPEWLPKIQRRCPNVIQKQESQRKERTTGLLMQETRRKVLTTIR